MALKTGNREQPLSVGTGRSRPKTIDLLGKEDELTHRLFSAVGSGLA